MSGKNAEGLSLWECLHDGSLNSLIADALNRTVTISVDVPYLWSFHSLPPDTRFRLVLQGVHSLTAMEFHSWPGEFQIPEGLTWGETEELRKRYYANGSYHSMNWQSVASQLEQTVQYELISAGIDDLGNGGVSLRIELMSDERSSYPEIIMKGDCIQFFLGQDRELSRADFLSLGEAYWEDFAHRSTSLSK
jgi:hypothetical protein